MTKNDLTVESHVNTYAPRLKQIILIVGYCSQKNYNRFFFKVCNSRVVCIVDIKLKVDYKTGLYKLNCKISPTETSLFRKMSLLSHCVIQISHSLGVASQIRSILRFQHSIIKNSL